MQNISDSNYIGLYNETVGEIVSEPNSIIISDADNNITSTRNINNNIDNQSIDLIKLNATGPLDNTHFLRGDGTWAIVSSAAASGFGTSGLTIANFIGTSSIDAYSYYYLQIGSVINFSLRVTSVNAFSGGGNIISFTVTGLPIAPALYNEFSPGSFNTSAIPSGQYQIGGDLAKNGLIFTIFWNYNGAVVNQDIHLYCQFSYHI